MTAETARAYGRKADRMVQGENSEVVAPVVPVLAGIMQL
jgi:hypothetical protein